MMALTAITARRVGQQVERNCGWFANALTCGELPKLSQLNQTWLTETQRGTTFLIGEVKDLTQRTLREVADRVVSR